MRSTFRAVRSRRGQLACAGAAVFATAGMSRAAVLYNDANTLNFIGDVNTLQTVTLAGSTPGQAYTINSISAVLYYDTTPAANPVLLLDVFSGVDETTPTNTTPTVDVQRNATEDGYFASFIPFNAGTGAHTFSLGSAAGINVPSGTFSVNVGLYSDGTFQTFSPDVVDVYSTTAPTVGTNLGYTYIDGSNAGTTPDGEFDANERRQASNPTAPLSIALVINATPIAVPEPTTAAALALATGTLAARRRRR